MINDSNQHIYNLKKKYYLYLLVSVIFTLSIKWVLSISEFGSNLNTLLLFNLKDTQYFPIVYSLSEYDFYPTYLENLRAENAIGFPILGAVVHALFYKIFGIYSFILLEYFFQIIFLIILLKVFNLVFLSPNR